MIRLSQQQLFPEYQLYNAHSIGGTWSHSVNLPCGAPNGVVVFPNTLFDGAPKAPVVFVVVDCPNNPVDVPEPPAAGVLCPKPPPLPNALPPPPPNAPKPVAGLAAPNMGFAVPV